jgi:hypothetical protein
MNDIIDIIKNLQTLTANDGVFQILKDFERVLDELDMYVYKNWLDGELLAGPDVNRYTVTCKFMWPRDSMPDPSGAAKLLNYGCKVSYKKDQILVPRKIKSPEDFRPGTKKGKIDAHPIWIVTISIPKKLMQDIYQGYADKENQAIADMMRYDQQDMTPSMAAGEAPQEDTIQNAETQAPA